MDLDREPPVRKGHRRDQTVRATGKERRGRLWEVQGPVSGNSSSSPKTWLTKSLGCNDDNSDCHSLDPLLCVR